MTLLHEWLRSAAQANPEKLAAVFCGASAPHAELTFGELDRQSDRVAEHFAGLGIGAGDRVAILHDNSAPGLVWFWGTLKAGACTVDVPGLAAAGTVAGILDEAQPKAVAVDARALAKAAPEGGPPLPLPKLVFSTADASGSAALVGRELHTLESIVAADPRQARVPAGALHQADPEDVALIVYTSGTTGRPSGVMLSHRNFVANLTGANALMGLGSDERILVVVPLYYIHGRMQLLLHAMLGGTLVFSRGFQFPQKVLQELVEHGCTGFSGVPYHFKQMLDRSKLASTPVPDLRYVLITGGALSGADLRRLEDAMPGVGIHLAYGQTEAAPRITWIGPEELFVKDGSVGRALPGVTLEIVGGDERALPAEQVGEVAAGGPNIMRGYVRGDHVKLGKIDAQGRLRTGDLGRLDRDGHLFLVGRSSEMIKCAGERIFPQEVEEVLLRHTSVREAAVVGVPDRLLGERMVAYVVLADTASLEVTELKAHCLQHLPFVRVPKLFNVVSELPKTGSGKVDRSALRRAASTIGES